MGEHRVGQPTVAFRKSVSQDQPSLADGFAQLHPVEQLLVELLCEAERLAVFQLPVRSDESSCARFQESAGQPPHTRERCRTAPAVTCIEEHERLSASDPDETMQVLRIELSSTLEQKTAAATLPGIPMAGEMQAIVFS